MLWFSSSGLTGAKSTYKNKYFNNLNKEVFVEHRDKVDVQYPVYCLCLRLFAKFFKRKISLKKRSSIAAEIRTQVFLLPVDCSEPLNYGGSIIIFFSDTFSRLLAYMYTYIFLI